MEKVVKHNVGVIVAVLSAPVTTVIAMTMFKAVYACEGSAVCGDIRNGIALTFGLVAVFIGARIVHRAVTGENLS